MQRQSLVSTGTLYKLEEIMLGQSLLTPFIYHLLELNSTHGVMQNIYDRVVAVNEDGTTHEDPSDGVVNGRVFFNLDINDDAICLKEVPYLEKGKSEITKGDKKFINVSLPESKFIAGADEFLSVLGNIYQRLPVSISAVNREKANQERKRQMEPIIVDVIMRALTMLKMTGEKTWENFRNALDIEDKSRESIDKFEVELIKMIAYVFYSQVKNRFDQEEQLKQQPVEKTRFSFISRLSLLSSSELKMTKKSASAPVSPTNSLEIAAIRLNVSDSNAIVSPRCNK